MLIEPITTTPKSTRESFDYHRTRALLIYGTVVEDRGYIVKLVGSIIPFLDAAPALLETHVERAETMKAAWEARPSRGEPPAYRLLMTGEIDRKGGIRVQWKPLLRDYDVLRSFNSLLVNKVGPMANTITAPKLVELSRLDTTGHPLEHRNLIFSTVSAICLLQQVLAQEISQTIEVREVDRIEFSKKLGLAVIDLELEEYTVLAQWVDTYSDGKGLTLGELRFAQQAGMSPLVLRNLCRSSGDKSASYSRATRQLSLMKRVEDFNTAWWRQGPQIPLPAPKGIPIKLK